MKIVLAGYYGFGNAGDELILQAIVNYLKKSGFSLANLTVLSKAPFRTSANYGVKSVNRWSAFSVIGAIARCELFILGGGGLLQDSTGKFGLWYYLLLLWLAIFCGKKVMSLAVGVGPLQWKINRKLVAFTLRHVDILTLRDRIWGIELNQSRESFPSVQIVADPVFCLQIEKVKKKEKPNDGLPKICLVLRNEKQTEQMAKMMAEFSRKISKELKGEICLLPFHPELDFAAIQSFLKELSANAKVFSDGKSAENLTVTVLEWSNLEELVQFFSETELVVSFRYHAIVLAVMMGIPVLGMSRDPKISNFMQDFFGQHGMKNWACDEEYDTEKVLSLALELWKKREKFQEIVNENLPRYRENAMAGLKHVLC